MVKDRYRATSTLAALAVSRGFVVRDVFTAQVITCNSQFVCLPLEAAASLEKGLFSHRDIGWIDRYVSR